MSDLANHWLVFASRYSSSPFADIADASIVPAELCYTKYKCPHADAQNLAGCELKTHDCVCQRGYELSDGICIGEWP